MKVSSRPVNSFTLTNEHFKIIRQNILNLDINYGSDNNEVIAN